MRRKFLMFGAVFVVVVLAAGLYFLRGRGGLGLDEARNDCGTYEAGFTAGEMTFTPNARAVSTCLVEAFSKCRAVSATVLTSDWEGGKTKRTYSVLRDRSGACRIERVTQVEAFYVYYGFQRHKTYCTEVEVGDKGTLAAKGCSSEVEQFGFCDNPNEEVKNEKYKCILKRALDNRSKEICRESDWEWSRNHCLYEVTILAGDARSCEELSGSWKVSCVEKMGKD